MKHPNFFEQDYGYTTTFSRRDFGAQFHEQRLDVAPLDVTARGVTEDQFESALVLPLHSKNGTTIRYLLDIINGQRSIVLPRWPK